MKKQRLTEELVENKIEETYREFRQIGKEYCRGFKDKKMCCQEMLSGFYDVFMKLFSDNHLELILKETNYPCFAEEFEEYKNGDYSFDPDHQPWLFDVEDDSCEATENDQKMFFYLMETFSVPPDYFKPLPEDVPCPELVPVHQYHTVGSYGIHYDCVDDGGLLGDEDPIGKTFKLMNNLGLEAVLTIKEDRRFHDRSGMDFDEIVYTTDRGFVISKAEFLAEGYIEGYTACERKGHPEILIRLKDGGKKVDWLAYWQEENDMKAQREYFLWQDYYNFYDEKQEILKQILSSLFEDFKNGS